MSAKLFVGNLNPKTTDEQLARFFSSAGIVVAVRVPRDRETGQSRGFAFVEFPSEEHAEQALKVFDGRELGGYQLRVSMARPESDNRRLAGRQAGQPEKRQGWPKADVSSPNELDHWSPSRDRDPYAESRSRRQRHHGKHGSDRRRRHGTRRFLD